MDHFKLCSLKLHNIIFDVIGRMEDMSAYDQSDAWRIEYSGGGVREEKLGRKSCVQHYFSEGKRVLKFALT